MTRTLTLVLLCAITIVGCSEQPDVVETPVPGGSAADLAAAGAAETNTSEENTTAEDPATAEPKSEDPATEEPMTEEPATKETPEGAAGQTAITPQNTKIEFVGVHTGDKPDPRSGSFGTFSGKADVNDTGLTSLSVEIDTTSIQTDVEKLTNHLKSPDFFDVREHPKASFRSTAIEASDNGVKITGDLTLHGKTQSITFPATVSTANGFSLKAGFSIDRSQFGMEFGLDKISKDVAMTVTVGG